MAVEEIVGSRPWCILRNLVHTVYREARHLGPAGDAQARVIVSAGPFLVAAKRCCSERANLKSRRLYNLTGNARSIADVLKPYETKTCLSVDDLISIFSLPNWRQGYGGPKWATIAKALKELISALEVEDIVSANQIVTE